MSQYESSTATLKTILSHPSLQRDAVDATLDAMADANAEARSVDDAIRSGLEVSQAEGAADIDDEEISRELEELMEEARREKEKEGTKLWPYGGSISLYNSVIAFCLLPYHALALHDFSLHHRSHVLYPYDRYDMIFSLSALQGSISQFRSSARLTVIDLVSRYNRHF